MSKTRPFGLQFVEVPPQLLANATGGTALGYPHEQPNPKPRPEPQQQDVTTQAMFPGGSDVF